ncbi:hypothetical protein BDF14DRAFT_1783576 [Spinellus fusiger]|nr:hypothetical protein BDF14DRAFT_1783576 [Spinellus fusiger]
MLQTKLKVNGFPSYYHRYKDDLPKSTNLNKVYRSGQPVDSDIYEQKQISMNQIYSETVVITDLFDEKTQRSFSTWCGTAKLDLTLADQTCKIQKNDVSKTKIRYRPLWIQEVFRI